MALYKNRTLPGGANLNFASSTTVKMTIDKPIVRILNRLQEPGLLQKMYFRLFGVVNCSHYLTLEDGDPFKIMKILKEYDIRFHRFGIDRTNYYCFDLASVSHMRIIQ